MILLTQLVTWKWALSKQTTLMTKLITEDSDLKSLEKYNKFLCNRKRRDICRWAMIGAWFHWSSWWTHTWLRICWCEYMHILGICKTGAWRPVPVSSTRLSLLVFIIFENLYFWMQNFDVVFDENSYSVWLKKRRSLLLWWAHMKLACGVISQIAKISPVKMCVCFEICRRLYGIFFIFPFQINPCACLYTHTNDLRLFALRCLS